MSNITCSEVWGVCRYMIWEIPRLSTGSVIIFYIWDAACATCVERTEVALFFSASWSWCFLSDVKCKSKRYAPVTWFLNKTQFPLFPANEICFQLYTVCPSCWPPLWLGYIQKVSFIVSVLLFNSFSLPSTRHRSILSPIQSFPSHTVSTLFESSCCVTKLVTAG